MRSTDRYVCLFCCKTVDPQRFHGLCRNPDCVAAFLERCGPADRARRASVFHPGKEIDVEKSLFKNIDPRSEYALIAPGHIVYGQGGGRCDVCGRGIDEYLCPICHGPISEGAKSGSNIIAVLGSEYSGKSHYTSALIDVLTGRYQREFGASVTPVVPRTEEVREEMRRRLFENSGTP